MGLKSGLSGPPGLRGPLGPPTPPGPPAGGSLNPIPIADFRNAKNVVQLPFTFSAIAKKVNGNWTTFLAFRKSAMGIGFRLPPAGGPGGVGGPNGPRRPGGPDKPDFNPMKHNPNDRFARLTPEQRVQRARERAQGGGQIIERRIEQN